MPHDAWHVLFFNPFFWEQTGKRGLNLRGVCKNFRKEIPERFSIESAFRGVLIRKVDVYRLFPLSVNDVVVLRSPLFFVDAFRLAVKKSGSFEFCIAVVREKGWTLRNSVGIKRDTHRAKLVADLAAGGVSWPVTGPLFESAVASFINEVMSRRQIFVAGAVVWRYDTILRGLSEWENQWEYDAILSRIHHAVGFRWYKGINRDVRSVCDGIRFARKSHAEGGAVGCMHHQHIAAGKFVFGVVKFRPEGNLSSWAGHWMVW
jgi:hypothetical protein